MAGLLLLLVSHLAFHCFQSSETGVRNVFNMVALASYCGLFILYMSCIYTLFYDYCY